MIFGSIKANFCHIYHVIYHVIYTPYFKLILRKKHDLLKNKFKDDILLYLASESHTLKCRLVFNYYMC